VTQVAGDFIAGPFGQPVQAYSGDSGSSLKRIRQNFSTTSLGPWTARWLIKPGTEDSVDFTLQDGTASNGGRFRVNLITGAVMSGPVMTGTATVLGTSATVLPSGFVDVSISVLFASALTQLQCIATLDFNGLSATTGTVYPACANLTNTAYPAPFTVATTAPGVIGNHNMSATLSALGITLGSEYGVGIDWSMSAVNASGAVAMSLSNSSYSSRVTLYREPNLARASVYASELGAALYYTGEDSAVGQVNRQAVRVKLNDYRASRNGALGSADNGDSALTTGIDRVLIGHALTGWSNPMAGRITRAYVIPTRAPSDADLAAMTA
jgi:hypothetical protein